MERSPVPVLTDGAWGTELQKLGLDAGADSWNITHPQLVEAVAAGYVAAGSRIILTNSFQSNRFALQRDGLEARVAEVNRAAAGISLKAAGSSARVFGSIGPIIPSNSLECTSDALQSAYLEQAEALAEAGVEALVLETFFNLESAVFALSVARRVGLPVLVSMTFRLRNEEIVSSDGSSPEEVAARLIEEEADAIGANCGEGPAQAPEICRRLRAAAGRVPVWMKPNASLPRMVHGEAVYDITPEQFAECARQLAAAGADYIGGCCGIGPAAIAAASAILCFSTGSAVW